METKSRYEVMAGLEAKKRDLISERDNLEQRHLAMKREIKELRRRLEDSEEDAKEFEANIPKRTETLNELIKSIDDSLSKLIAQRN